MDFSLFQSNNCSGTDIQDDLGNSISGGTPIESDPHLVLAVDIPALSYHVTYTDTSGDYNNANVCEPLEVKSSITEFDYTVVGSSGGPYSCTLEAKAANGGTCPAGTSEATVVVCSTNTYTVTIGVTNNTGVSITEKVQGGLAANATYTPVANTVVDVPSDGSLSDCGNAVLNLSQSNNKTGNVIIWNLLGTALPTPSQAAPFSMLDTATCTLQWQETKKFTSCGEQPVTSSWSEFQTGPGSFSGKSPYTGDLLVFVQ